MKRQVSEPDHLPPSSADTDIEMEMYFHSYVQEIFLRISSYWARGRGVK